VTMKAREEKGGEELLDWWFWRWKRKELRAKECK
jgi:hypothetical protein